MDEALSLIEELFLNLEKLPSTFTTSTHFSRLHLNIVESAIQAVVSLAGKEN